MKINEACDGRLNRHNCIDTTTPEVDIVVLNWNGWKDTIECLESLLELDYENYRIVIVDNASTDDSVSRILSWVSSTVAAGRMDSHPHHEFLHVPVDAVREAVIADKNGLTDQSCNSRRYNDVFIVLVENDANEGYSGGNNAGIVFSRRVFKPPFIMLLNNDTVVTSDFLRFLVSSAVENEDAGLLGPLVRSYGNNETIQQTAGTMSMWMGRRQPIRVTFQNMHHIAGIELHYLSGVAILIRTSALDRIGLLDTDYFMYTEDIDFSFRVRNAGYRITMIPSSVIFHKIAQSSGGLDSAFVNYHVYRNSILFMRKNARWYHWPTYIAASAIVAGFRILQMTIRDPKMTKSMLKGVTDGFLGH